MDQRSTPHTQVVSGTASLRAALQRPVRHERGQLRRGVALMVVLGLLSMFVLVAVTFVMTSNAAKEAAMSARDVEMYGDPPEAILNRALYSVVRGSNDPFNRIGPHSLLEDMYGNQESIVGAIFVDTLAATRLNSFPNSTVTDQLKAQLSRSVQGQFLELNVVSFGDDKKPGVANVDDGDNQVPDDLEDLKSVTSLSALPGDDRQLGSRKRDSQGRVVPDGIEGYYAGRLLTFLDGPAKNETVRIVRYFNRQTDDNQDPDFRVLVTRPGNGQNPLLRPDGTFQPVRVVINGRPFNGAGFGYAPHRGGMLSLTHRAIVDNNPNAIPYSTPSDPSTWPIAFTPNPSEASYQQYLRELPDSAGVYNRFGVDADEDYDVADYQNMLLAGAVWSREQGHSQRWLVRIPSLHRPELVAFHMNLLDNSNYNPSQAGTYLSPHDNVSWANILKGGSLTDSTVPRVRQKLILRPDPQDHVATGQWAPGMPEWSGNPHFHPIHGPWDVDNDSDGEPDSIWVDLGAPVQTSETGKSYKALFAILCLDMDGRFNVNVHGNWTHYSVRPQFINQLDREGEDYGGPTYSNDGLTIANGPAAYQTGLAGADLLLDSVGSNFYHWGARSMGRSYIPNQGGVLNDSRSARKLFYWGHDNDFNSQVVINDMGGGPFAGSVQTTASLADTNPWNARYTGSSDNNGKPYGSLWSSTGQGFSVAEINLGGVLPLPSQRYPNTPSSTQLPRWRTYAINPYRLLLEGSGQGAAAPFGGAGLHGEGRYGERGSIFAQGDAANRGRYFQQFNEVSGFFSKLSPSATLGNFPAYARPGITFVDDNSPLPPSLGTGPDSYTHLFHPDLSDGQNFHRLMNNHVLVNDPWFAQLVSRGNRWTDASYTFWGTGGGVTANAPLAMQGVGNYGFHVDPAGHMGVALDLRGTPYMSFRSTHYARGAVGGSPPVHGVPSYVGNSFIANANPWGAEQSPWRLGFKWQQINPAVDDPWEMNVYTSSVSRAFKPNTTVPQLTSAPLTNQPALRASDVSYDPLDERGQNWRLATDIVPAYPRGNSADLNQRENPNRLSTFYVDRPFDARDLEGALRQFDKDIATSGTDFYTRLGGAVPVNDGDVGQDTSSIRRWLLTTDSWDLPMPHLNAPPEIATALEVAADKTINTSFPVRWNNTNLSISDLVFGKIIAANAFATKAANPSGPQTFPTRDDITTLLNTDFLSNSAKGPRLTQNATRFNPKQIIPRDLLLGTRLDINRPFGNAIDDDFDGIVDEPPPTGPGMLHRSRVSYFESTEHFQPTPSSDYGEQNVLYTDVGNTNRASGSTLNSNNTFAGRGVPMEASNWLQPSPNTYLKDSFATFDGSTWQVNPNAADMSRQDLAKHLYILAMLVNEVSWQFPYGGGDGTGAGNLGADDEQLKQGATDEHKRRRIMAAYRCAQWAVNCVDFRDRDSIMTPFEFDLNPFVDDIPDDNGDMMVNDQDEISTWNVNGYIELPDTGPGSTAAYNGSNQLIYDKYNSRLVPNEPPVLPPPGMTSTVDRDSIRGLVWGMEAPELLITETLAFHDLRVADTDKEEIVMGRSMRSKTTSMGTDPDPTLDQVRIPQGSLFVELYCAAARQAQPNPYHPDLSQFPTELYDVVSNDPKRSEQLSPSTSNPTENRVFNRSARFGLLDLSRLAPPTKYNNGTTTLYYRLPVWRLAISRWHVNTGNSNRKSVQDTLYGAGGRPHTCTLAPFTKFPDATTAEDYVNMNWMAAPATSYMKDRISTNLFATAPTGANADDPDSILLDRFVWFVDQTSLDGAPPANVFCFHSSNAASPPTPGTIPPVVPPSGTTTPLRFLLEPGHYAVVGPERLYRDFIEDSGTNMTRGKLSRRNFLTVTAQPSYFPNSQTPPKADSRNLAWYPAYFDLSPILRQPRDLDNTMGIVTFDQGIKYYEQGIGASAQTTALTRNTNKFYAPDIVNFVRSGSSLGTISPTGKPTVPGNVDFQYPITLSPQELYQYAAQTEAGSDTVLPVADIKTPVPIPVATRNYLSGAQNTMHPFSGLNISEPLGGYSVAGSMGTAPITMTLEEMEIPMTLIDSVDDGALLDSFLPPNTGNRPLVFPDGLKADTYPDVPFDAVSAPGDSPDGSGNSEIYYNGTRSAEQRNMLTPGTYRDVRTVFLQRLANPAASWHPIYNPYITVDWMPLDLTVYNGQFVWQEDWDSSSMSPLAPELPITDDTKLLPANPGGMTVPQVPVIRPGNFASRERGLSPQGLRTYAQGNQAEMSEIDELPLWPAVSIEPEFNKGWDEFPTASSPNYGGNVGWHQDPRCSLGYLNNYYKGVSGYGSLYGVDQIDMLNRGSRPRQPGPLRYNEVNSLVNTSGYKLTPGFVAVDYIGSPPRAYPWVTWLNRPFASHMELLLVPASSPSRFTTEFNYLGDRLRTLAANGVPDSANGADITFSQPSLLGQLVSSGANGGAYWGVHNQQTRRRWPFAHLLNFFASGRPDDPGDPNAVSPAYDNQRMDLTELSNQFLARPNLYRLLEFVHVPTRFSGAEDFIVPFQNGNQLDPASLVFAPPFNRLPKFREPGKVNLNTFAGAITGDSTTITAAQHWGALVNFTPSHEKHWELFNRTRYAGNLDIWLKGSAANQTVPVTADNPWIETNGQQPRLFNSTMPSIYANPFKAYTNSLRVPHYFQRMRKGPFNVWNTPPSTQQDLIARPYHRYADTSFLKWDDRGQQSDFDTSKNPYKDVPQNVFAAPYNEGMFVTQLDDVTPSTIASGGGKTPFRHIQDATRNPYFRYQDYIKLGNVATTHSNVYAVWVTMGMFELERVQSDNSQAPNFRAPSVIGTTNPDGYRLVREMGTDTGDIQRHRAFMLIDRSIPVGFQRGENLNVDKAIRVRRIIE